MFLIRSLLFHWLLSQTGRLYADAAGCGEPAPVANAYRHWEGGAEATWVNYTCLDGYDHMEGDLERWCSGGGYSGTPPVCQLNCGPPLTYNHSTPHANSTRSEQYADYTCKGNTNQTTEYNHLYCDPAPGRWESPVFCAEKETIMDSIRFLPLSTNGSDLTEETTSAAGDATGVIDITANSILISTSDSTTMINTHTSSDQSISDTATLMFPETSSVDVNTNSVTSISVGISSVYPTDASSSLHASDIYPSSDIGLMSSSSYLVPSSPLSTTVPLFQVSSFTDLVSASDTVISDKPLSLLPTVHSSIFSLSAMNTSNLVDYLLMNGSTSDVTWSLDPSSVTMSMPSTDFVDTCPRQNKLIVKLDGGPYEILHVVLVRPPDEDLYNFKLDVFSPSSACYSASRLPLENRTTVSCTGDRLFPIGDKIIVRGSDPDHGTLRICDVEVYGRVPSVDCGVPEPYPGRRVVFTTTSLNSTAIYYCEKGYHYRGGGQLIDCSISGYWKNYDLICSDKEKIEAAITTAYADPELNDNNIETCSPVNGTTQHLTLDLRDRYEVKMVTITTPANTSAASLTITISRDGLNKSCSISNPPFYTHKTGEVTVAVGCITAPVGDQLDLYISGIIGSLCEVKVFGRLYTGEPIECLQSSRGSEFKGTINQTVTGQVCQPWPQTTMNLDHFPDMTWDEAGNYCRNPNSHTRPWCYTATNETQDCPIVYCDLICLRFGDGSTYRGNTGMTKQGQNCLSWSDSSVPFKRTALFPWNSVGHKCRNPASSMRWPWCYTDKSGNYAYCSIPTCPKESEYSTSYFRLDHVGVLQTLTSSNFTECYIWKKSSNDYYRLESDKNLENHVMDSCGHTFSLNMTLLCSVPQDNVTAWVYAVAECVDCGVPAFPYDMTVDYTSTFFPSEATFSCASGYVWDGGTGNFTCLGTGDWDNATLACIVDCRPPLPVIGTSDLVIYNRTVLGSIAQYTCVETKETTNVTCQSSGLWEEPVWVITCPVDCGSPSSLSNMNVTYNGTLTNDTALYQCVAGYPATGGSGNAVCQDDGKWSTPSLVCTADCGPPPSSSNTNVTYNMTLASDVAVYQCVAGYLATGGSGDSLCQSDGIWSTPTLVCTVDCGSPSSLSNMNVTYNGTLTNDTALYQCVAGYPATGGSGNAVCQDDGKWSTPSLVCTADCGPPPSSSNTNVTYNMTLASDVAVYQCVAGYLATGGSGDSLCQSDGIWSTPTLVCTESNGTSSVGDLTDSSSSVFLADPSSSASATSTPPTSFPDSSSYSLPFSSSLSSSSISYSSSESLSSSFSNYPSSFSDTSSSSSFSSSSVFTLHSSFSSLDPSPSSSLSNTPSSVISTSISYSVSSTTPITPSTASTSPSCVSLCFCGSNDKDDDIKLEQFKKEIKEKLLLDETNLSKAKRKRTSASDSRPSAQAIGHSAWIMLAIMFGFMLITDIISMVKGVVKLAKRTKRITSRFAW